MKKVLLCIIFLVLLGMTIYFSIRLYSVKNSNNDLNNELNKVSSSIKEVEENNKKYEVELSDLKESSKDKLEEEEIWIKAKEKLTQA